MILNLECFTNIFNFSLHFSKQTNEQNLEIITLCSSCLGETDLEEISNPCQKAFFSNNECSLIFSIKLSVQCMHLLYFHDSQIKLTSINSNNFMIFFA